MDDDFDRGFDGGQRFADWLSDAIGVWPAAVLTLALLFIVSFVVVTAIHRRTSRR